MTDGATGAADARVAELLAEYSAPGASTAELLCDRHPEEGVAFTIVGPDRSVRPLTYGELREKSTRFATALAGAGVGPGDRVATLMGKSEELVVAMVGIWRLGAVHVPLFTAFAPPAIAYRLTGSQAKVVIADSSQRPKLDPGDDIPASPPWTVVVTGPGPAAGGDLSFDDLLAGADPAAAAPPAALGGEAEIGRLFTSGTTGTPKGVPIPLKALASFVAYFEFGLDVRADDVYWDAADPGWGYGLFYGIMAPLAAGRTNILLQGGFSPELTYWVMQTQRVTNFAVAPTVYRVLRSSDVAVPDGLVLRRCSSAGEPLNPQVISWSEQVLGVPVHDTYGQTELGMTIINGWHPLVARPLKPASMGHPMPGWTVDVFLDDRDEPAPPGTLGRVVIDVPASPLMWFDGYVDAPEKTAERFSADRRWYYTGDAATKDDEGYFFFSARDDDVIIMAGYRIGPFEVESVLVTHPDVAEAAVVAVPDELRGEALEAFVVLRNGVSGTADLAVELQQLVKTKYAAHAYPRQVHFIDTMPVTPSGKVQRYVLRNRRREELANQR